MKRYILFLFIVFILASGFAFIPTHASAQADASSTAAVVADDVNPTILPTSRFYFLKEWWRGAIVFITRDPVAKTKLQLQILNEKAAEAKKIFETQSQNLEALNKAAQNYIDAKKKLEAKLEALKDNPNVALMLNKVSEQIKKHTELFKNLGDKILEKRSNDNALEKGE